MPRGFAILCDSAFTEGQAADDKTVREREKNERSELVSLEIVSVDTIMQRLLPSERQYAEWGIRAFRTPFDLLRLPLSRDSETRQTLLLVCAHLLNLRTRGVRLSQIRKVYAIKEDVCQPWALRFMQEQNIVRSAGPPPKSAGKRP